MSFRPITGSSPQANPLANPNTPLPAQNTAAESSEPSHNLPLHLRRFEVTEGTVAYLEDGNTVKRILLQKDTTSPIFTLPSTFKPNQSVVTTFSKQTSRHPLTFYTNIPPNNLSLAVQDRYMSMRNPSQSEQHTTSSLKGTFTLPFESIPSLTHTETTTNTTLSWPYKRPHSQTVFVPLELSHEYTINFGTIPDSEKDPTNIKRVKTSMIRSTRDRVTLSLKISIPIKLNKHPDMCFSILSGQGLIWQYYPHTHIQTNRLAKISIQDFSFFKITNSGSFDRTYSVHQLLQGQHPGYFRSTSHIEKIKFHLTMQPNLNGSLTNKTEISIKFSEYLPGFIRESPKTFGIKQKNASTIQQTKFVRRPKTKTPSVAYHLHTNAFTTYYNGPTTSSPAAPQNESASTYTAPSSDPSSDNPFVKKPRISSFDCTEASLPQIPLNERLTSGFLPHDPELAEFFANFNGPLDSSLNSPSPPNFDFPLSDDPLKKLLQLLNSPDETRSQSSARLKPIFSSDLFDENSK